MPIDRSRLYNAQPREKGADLKAGLYSVKIKRCLADRFETKHGPNDALVIEVEVMKSSNPQQPVGSSGRQFISMKYADSGFGEAKLFIYAVLGLSLAKDREKIKAEVDPEAKINKLWDEMIDKNAFADSLVDVEVYIKPSRKDTGKEFATYRWSPAGALAIAA